MTEVTIGPDAGSGVFQVMVESPAGQVATEVGLDLELLPQRARLEEVLLASAVPACRLVSVSERVVLEAGRRLFGALLGAGEIGGVYRASAALAADQGEPLRVALTGGLAHLAVLQWGTMYDSTARGYVCPHHQLIRRVTHTSVPPRPPLQIPASRGSAPLDAERERAQLTQALGGAAGQGLAELAWAEEASWEELLELLLARPWLTAQDGPRADIRIDGQLAAARQGCPARTIGGFR